MPRVYAIGDIHGCAGELETLLDALPVAAGDRVVFVGDYLDRGPECGRVLDLLIGWRPSGVERVFLRGNHEDMCLAYLGKPGRWGESWWQNGARATVRSYGFEALPPSQRLLEAMPPAHLAFLGNLAMTYATATHLFVHAGIRPDVPLAAQDPEDLLWIRDDFIEHRHDLDATVVFGHTPMRDVYVDPPQKIGIDTGCVYGGALSAIELEEGVLHQVPAGARRARRVALAARA